MKTKEAIVLAGGLGTRLQTVLPGIPKCMAPVNGKPFLTYILDYLISQNINKVILSVGYRNDQIIKYFGDNYLSITIKYAIENEPLGTGGTVKFAFDHCIQDQVFVINGDTYFLPDMQLMEKQHIQSKADITIAVKHMPETARYGLVHTDVNGRITDFREKEPNSANGWINGGIYLVDRSIFDNFPNKKFSLEKDIFRVSCSSFKIMAFQTEAEFLDMGIPEDYTKAQSMIAFENEK